MPEIVVTIALLSILDTGKVVAVGVAGVLTVLNGHVATIAERGDSHGKRTLGNGVGIASQAGPFRCDGRLLTETVDVESVGTTTEFRTIAVAEHVTAGEAVKCRTAAIGEAVAAIALLCRH